MTQAIAKQAPEQLSEAIERILIAGDLSRLNPEQRVEYYNRVCASLGLNPLTKPFDYIALSGRLTLYARKDCTDQLRRLYGVSVLITSRAREGDCWVVTAKATTADGRTDESIGAVSVGNAKGDALANLLMKAETKAKRRVTLSLCGLGMLDESELETVPNAKPVPSAPVTAQTAEPDPQAEAPQPEPPVNDDDPLDLAATLQQLVEQAAIHEKIVAAWLEKAGVKALSDMSPAALHACIGWARRRLAEQQAQQPSE